MTQCPDSRPDTVESADAAAAWRTGSHAAEHLIQSLQHNEDCKVSAKALLSVFWEGIAAPLLQPGPAGPQHIAWLDCLLRAGLLHPVLGDLTAAGEAHGLQYLDHADADAAVNLLLFLTIVPAQPSGG